MLETDAWVTMAAPCRLPANLVLLDRVSPEFQGSPETVIFVCMCLLELFRQKYCPEVHALHLSCTVTSTRRASRLQEREGTASPCPLCLLMDIVRQQQHAHQRIAFLPTLALADTRMEKCVISATLFVLCKSTLQCMRMRMRERGGDFIKFNLYVCISAAHITANVQGLFPLVFYHTRNSSARKSACKFLKAQPSATGCPSPAGRQLHTCTSAHRGLIQCHFRCHLELYIAAPILRTPITNVIRYIHKHLDDARKRTSPR